MGVDNSDSVDDGFNLMGVEAVAVVVSGSGQVTLGYFPEST